MKEITIAQLIEMVKKEASQIKYATAHWSAGRYGQFFGNEYPLEIDFDGKLYISSNSLLFRPNGKKFQHTSQRNTGNVGVGLCAAFGAQADKDGLPTGNYPPTAAQIEMLAKVFAVISMYAQVQLTRQYMCTHAEWAIIDGYGPVAEGGTGERWDLWKLKDYDGSVKNGGDVIRGKAQWYKEKGVL